MFHFFVSFLSRMTRKSSQAARSHVGPRNRLWVEELSSRVLPSASPLGLISGHSFDHHAHAIASSSSITASDASHSSNAAHASGTCAGEANFVANLTNASGATGTASFNSANNSLKVQV